MEKEKVQILDSVEKVEEQDYLEYLEAMKQYDIRVLVYRLIFVTPVLGLGIFFFIKFRDNKYAAIFWGYIFFSLFMFFVAIIPYLYLFGYYFNYSVGVALAITIGH